MGEWCTGPCRPRRSPEEQETASRHTASSSQPRRPHLSSSRPSRPGFIVPAQEGTFVFPAHNRPHPTETARVSHDPRIGCYKPRCPHIGKVLLDVCQSTPIPFRPLVLYRDLSVFIGRYISMRKLVLTGALFMRLTRKDRLTAPYSYY
ncbi:cittilin family RiPP precursor [Streptomyces sp. NPDC056638]|uniref:cittilin family RiPP precursor n=1 Tax=Streptomyces sp. NPDC056638 TaxID=3345887 RepID=UPI0036BBF6D8